MKEAEIPNEISGAAFGVACLIGYAPGMSAFMIYDARHAGGSGDAPGNGRMHAPWTTTGFPSIVKPSFQSAS